MYTSYNFNIIYCYKIIDYKSSYLNLSCKGIYNKLNNTIYKYGQYNIRNIQKLYLKKESAKNL